MWLKIVISLTGESSSFVFGKPDQTATVPKKNILKNGFPPSLNL
jgi:hypothetical protein